MARVLKGLQRSIKMSGRLLSEIEEDSRPGGLLEWVVYKKGVGRIGMEVELGRRVLRPDHSLRDKTVIVGHTVFVQRPLSRWNRESGVFKIPGEMAKWVNNWEHKQTQGH